MVIIYRQNKAISSEKKDKNMKKSITDITGQNTPIVSLTAYTTPMASMLGSHCDLLLVGDSLAMVLYGFESTRGATIDMMIAHGQAVMRAQPNSVVIVDMPYGSYETSPLQALENAQRIMDETSCDGVKLEGGTQFADTIAYLVQNDIPVLAHIGLLPQSVETPDGYKVQGREEDSAQQLLKDAKAVEEVGAFATVIEAVPETLAATITKEITIPTIGIGASAACDGQILVAEDMLGLHTGRVPKFVKQYAQLSETIEQVVQSYANAVKQRTFPEKQHTYGDKKTEALKKAS